LQGGDKRDCLHIWKLKMKKFYWIQSAFDRLCKQMKHSFLTIKIAFSYFLTMTTLTSQLHNESKFSINFDPNVF
jgi:hypothetical protein